MARTVPHARLHPKFDTHSISSEVANLFAEINRLNRRSWNHDDPSVVVSTNVRPTLRGVPAANQPEPADSGVAVYFKLIYRINQRAFERPVVLTCDRWIRVADNVRAIVKDIEAQRGRARWGCTNLEQAFRGYTAIPERCGARPWWEVLGIPSTTTLDGVKDAFRELAKSAHPDKGGQRDEWNRLQEAYDQGIAATNGH